MLDLLLIATLGFLGSFGHCVGMCGPLAIALSLSESSAQHPWPQQLRFHLLLNLGRITSYALVGAGIGGLGSVLVASGQLAGIDSLLRRGMAIATGLLLVWLGLTQIRPGWLPSLPLLHPLTQGKARDRLNAAMLRLSLSPHWWTPALLGMAWGLIPCGFLYTAQVRAAETGDWGQGAATMLAFGAGTLPMMVGVGVSTAWLSRDRRSQLFRLGGWVTLTIGLLLLLRTGDMVDYTGHAALLLLMLALIARPISRLWAAPLRYRRGLGVGAFGLAVAHSLHMLDHSFRWNLTGVDFLLPNHQLGFWLGVGALVLMTPAALTSSDWMVARLGAGWRPLHLLTIPALLVAALHTILLGSHYLGGLEWTLAQKLMAGLIGGVTLGILLLRSRQVWKWLAVEQWYGASVRSK